jgi:hypothetical protein
MPLPTIQVVEIINSVLSELNASLGIKKNVVAGLYGAKNSSTKNKTLILARASHMRRLASVLGGHGYTVKLVGTKNWRATTKMVMDLLAEVKEAMSGLDTDNTVLVLGMMDNSYFKARFEDGDAIPICRRIDGSFHVDGDIICSPLETARAAFQQVVPMLKALPEMDKILLTPLPRYLWTSCCADPQHAPNVKNEDHVVNMLADIESTNRAWRSICFHEKIRNIKLCNAGSVLAVKLMWGRDPVHPNITGYEKVAEYLLNGIASMEAKRASASLELLEADQVKRLLAEPEAGPSFKRGVCSGGDYVSRDSRWTNQGHKGYGGHGSRGGWANRGRGGWLGYRGRGKF